MIKRKGPVDMKKMLSVILAVIMLFSLSVMSYAKEEYMTTDEAKEYLLNYRVKETDSQGKEITTWYEFDSPEDLEKVADYIANHGLAAFDSAIEDALAEAVEAETQDVAIRPFFTDPVTAYAKISGDGKHNVYTEGTGLVKFASLGAAEYRVTLGYKVTVTNGKITGISSISFDIPQVGPSSTWGNLRISPYYRDKVCGVTANYDITKSLNISIGGGGFQFKTEKAMFALITNLT